MAFNKNVQNKLYRLILDKKDREQVVYTKLIDSHTRLSAICASYHERKRNENVLSSG